MWGTCCGTSEPLASSLSVPLQCAFGAALLNVQIPLLLGKVVNVVAQHMEMTEYLRGVHRPALRLLAIYALQVSNGIGGLFCSGSKWIGSLLERGGGRLVVGWMTCVCVFFSAPSPGLADLWVYPVAVSHWGGSSKQYAQGALCLPD